ncbi:MAG: response regulator [Spongiibacteraceae bacterium]
MPHALIVDDSKTARYALRVLLDRQNFTSDMVESGEQALEYLHSNNPDIIFMDHMMPGMDGFQAVKAIKSNAATTAIPIVMYTSTQGGMYFGQARALGAADVISKPASAEDLSAVLQRLEEHQLLGANKAAPQEPNKWAEPARDVEPLSIEVEATEEPTPTPIKTATPAQPIYMSAASTTPPPTAARWPAWLTTLSLVASVVLAVLYFRAVNYVAPLQKQRLLAFKTVEWALNRTAEYPYGEAPFSGDRLTLLQELVQQLNAAGFKGKIRLESHVGQFCLRRQPSADGSGAIWALAPDDSRLTDCSALGQSNEQSQSMSAEQSASFKRFMNELPEGIQIDLVPLGAGEPKVEYPNDPAVTAGQWNSVARHNQRVQIVLLPDQFL